MGTAYIEDSCNTKNLCLYKDITNYDICKPVETDETHEFLNQVDNNNFNISYTTQSENQYASCSNHNISMISAACYSNSAAVNYSTVSYNAVYPIKDVNKNYEEVSLNPIQPPEVTLIVLTLCRSALKLTTKISMT